MTNYSSTPLVKKLGIKEGMRVMFVNTPENYKELLEGLSKNIQETTQQNITSKKQDTTNKRKDMDFIHFFTRSQEVLREEFGSLKERLKLTGMLWISWPKSSCSFASSDLTENVIRAIGLENGLVDVKIASIDEDWSGLKFVYRVKDRI